MSGPLDAEAIKPYLDGVMHAMDTVTPDVAGMSRTEIVALAVYGYFTGAAAAMDFHQMIPVGQENAEAMYADPKRREMTARMLTQIADGVVDRIEGGAA